MDQACCFRLNGLGRLVTIAWLVAAESAATVLARLAQLGWGRQTKRAAHPAVNASRTPDCSLPGRLALRCRPRYRTCAACRPPLARPPLTCASCTFCTSCVTRNPPGTVLAAAYVGIVNSGGARTGARHAGTPPEDNSKRRTARSPPAPAIPDAAQPQSRNAGAINNGDSWPVMGGQTFSANDFV